MYIHLYERRRSKHEHARTWLLVPLCTDRKLGGRGRCAVWFAPRPSPRAFGFTAVMVFCGAVAVLVGVLLRSTVPLSDPPVWSADPDRGRRRTVLALAFAQERRRFSPAAVDCECAG